MCFFLFRYRRRTYDVTIVSHCTIIYVTFPHTVSDITVAHPVYIPVVIAHGGHTSRVKTACRQFIIKFIRCTSGNSMILADTDLLSLYLICVVFFVSLLSYMLRVANQQLSTSVSLLQRYGHQFSFLWVFNGTYILVNCSVMSPFFVMNGSAFFGFLCL